MGRRVYSVAHVLPPRPRRGRLRAPPLLPGQGERAGPVGRGAGDLRRQPPERAHRPGAGVHHHPAPRDLPREGAAVPQAGDRPDAPRDGRAPGLPEAGRPDPDGQERGHPRGGGERARAGEGDHPLPRGEEPLRARARGAEDGRRADRVPGGEAGRAGAGGARRPHLRGQGPLPERGADRGRRADRGLALRPRRRGRRARRGPRAHRGDVRRAPTRHLQPRVVGGPAAGEGRGGALRAEDWREGARPRAAAAASPTGSGCSGASGRSSSSGCAPSSPRSRAASRW